MQSIVRTAVHSVCPSVYLEVRNERRPRPLYARFVTVWMMDGHDLVVFGVEY